jgi:hypothetical protein
MQTNDELERPAMSDLVRFDVGISGGLITSAEGKWVSYASHCASRDALVNVVDAQANEIERLRAWQRTAIDMLTLGYGAACAEHDAACLTCQAHDLIGGAQS